MSTSKSPSIIRNPVKGHGYMFERAVSSDNVKTALALLSKPAHGDFFVRTQSDESARLSRLFEKAHELGHVVGSDETNTEDIALRGHIVEIFQALDKNGDGSLQPSEIDEALSKIGQSIPVDSIKEFCSKYGKDGCLSLPDFAKLVFDTRNESKRKEEAAAMFHKLDLSGDGKLQPQEVKLALKELGMQMKDNQVEKFCKEHGTNGELTQDDFELLILGSSKGQESSESVTEKLKRMLAEAKQEADGLSPVSRCRQGANLVFSRKATTPAPTKSETIQAKEVKSPPKQIFVKPQTALQDGSLSADRGRSYSIANPVGAAQNFADALRGNMQRDLMTQHFLGAMTKMRSRPLSPRTLRVLKYLPSDYKEVTCEVIPETSKPKPKENQKPKLRDVFDKYDKLGLGFLGIDEARMAMKDLGEYTDEPHFSSLFAKMDFKNVGEVTYSDFEEVLSKEMKNDMGSSDSSESAEKVLSRLKTMRREVNAELVHTRTILAKSSALLVNQFRGMSESKLKERIKIAFDTYDTSKDGILQPNEVKEALRGLGQTLDDAAVEAFCSEHGTNGEISLSDFESMVRNALAGNGLSGSSE
mmetsp:Transcript_21336/g.48203  ORF Transcript_21336/g.48203 Transcript_21336/m.48203 type:complete len:587 (-) Transcript_21336:230-1990(-)